MHVSSWCLLSHLECLDPSEWSVQDDTEDAIDNELLSLLKPLSEEGNSGDRGCWSLLLLLCPQPWGRLSGCLLVVRTVVSGHIPRWGSPLGIKLKRLLGWWIYSGTSRSPHLHSIIQYSLGNGPFSPLVLSLGQQ